ncbi:hypothetical protein PV08_06817 [Exophiala spinifera]|uniref:Oxidoreductase n=1 Tax=Exophiala spinifera TaxID=91928 RepID=A0A0D1YGC9_9EURO|nr:uncharacterized protein PV08_06817 [Exophiala spinifera]KIW14036.1 hypothetical protein PV08_06817 [Exophiala spinifera]
MVNFNPRTDIPPLTDKVILVTGGNIGLGKQSILEFVRHQPKEIWLAARNLEKATAAAEDIKRQVPGANITLLEMDLSSLESVKNAADRVLATTERLDILMLNAGIMAAPPGTTKDGYEVQWATNHLGHALLAKLLVPLLEKTAKRAGNGDGAGGGDVRIVCLSSRGHVYGPKGGVSFESLKTDGATLGAYQRYGQSKLGNILWAREMSRRYPWMKVVSVHPGVVGTNLLNGATGSPAWIKAVLGASKAVGLTASVEKGVRNQLWAATADEDKVKNGEYFEPVGVMGKGSKESKDDDLARKVWEWTEAELDRFLA